MKTKEIGDMGEQIAEKYLKRRFWRIVSNNFKVHGGEIDLIGYRFGTLIFVEVKTRSNDKYGSPAQAVSESKLASIEKAARVFLDTYGKGGALSLYYPISGRTKRKQIIKRRIDVIEVYLQDRKYKVNHIKSYQVGKEL